jgi:hypothetical protein
MQNLILVSESGRKSNAINQARKYMKHPMLVRGELHHTCNAH